MTVGGRKAEKRWQERTEEGKGQDGYDYTKERERKSGHHKSCRTVASWKPHEVARTDGSASMLANRGGDDLGGRAGISKTCGGKQAGNTHWLAPGRAHSN